MKNKLIIIAFLLTLSTQVNAQIIGATNRNERNQTQIQNNNKNNSKYRSNGPVLKFELLEISSLSIGYQIHPCIFVGGGIGFAFEEENLPLFIEGRFSTPLRKFALFLDTRNGLDLFEGDYYMSYQAGIMLGNFTIGAGAAIIDFDEVLPLFSISYDLNLKKLF